VLGVGRGEGKGSRAVSAPSDHLAKRVLKAASTPAERGSPWAVPSLKFINIQLHDAITIELFIFYVLNLLRAGTYTSTLLNTIYFYDIYPIVYEINIGHRKILNCTSNSDYHHNNNHLSLAPILCYR